MDLHVHSKAIENGVHGAVVADQFHFLAFAVVHSERGLDVVIDIEVGWNRRGRLIQNRRLLIDSVHPEVSNVLVLFGIAYHVITVSVPDQIVRTKYVFLAAVLQRFFLLRVVVVILKRNLFTVIDCLVNRIGNYSWELLYRCQRGLFLVKRVPNIVGIPSGLNFPLPSDFGISTRLTLPGQ